MPTATLTIRRPQFDLPAQLPLRWLGGDAFRSQAFNTLSMMFPVGEQYFIDSLRRVAERVEDPALRAQVRDFIAQEAIHRRIHGEFNRRLADLGLRNLVEVAIAWRIRHAGWLSALDHLAVTAAYEHYTAILGEALLEDDRWLADALPALRPLWIWHAIEEVEHKAVSLTVYRTQGGGDARRLAWYVYASFFLTLDLCLQTLFNLWRSGDLLLPRTWLEAARFLFGRHAFVGTVLRGWVRYLRPGYLPRHGATLERAAQWLEQNREWFGPPGADGAAPSKAPAEDARAR